VAGTLVVDKWAVTEHPERQQRQLSGCLVAFMVGIGVLLLVAVLGVLAAIAIPAYHDYTIRAKVVDAVFATEPVKQAVAGAESSTDCPANDSPGFKAAEAYAARGIASIELGRLEDERCGMVVRLAPALHDDPEQAWIALSYEPEARRWDCWSGLPDAKLPASCRD
jgi:type IV pilus assembly protein PilA